MPNYQVTAETPVPSGFAVDQVRGMFDLAAEKVAKVSFDVELPADDELIANADGTPEPWRIGVIVGPSGSGKTTVARHAYGKRFSEGGYRWDKSKAVCDHFAGVSMKTVSQAFNAVGFSSPPSWIKPHHVLSGGERFRCDLVRALLKSGDLVAFDEFTSVVDRTVAKIGSAAIAKSIRKNHFGTAKQFVAVTCHYDVIDWLEPDWVLDMASSQLARGRLRRRPTIELQVARVDRSAWDLFRRHHYLNTSIMPGATCFAAFWEGEPVAFEAWTHRITTGRRGDMRGHRSVVLPDFQGIGIGLRFHDLCASLYHGIGRRAFSTTSHPAFVHAWNRSPNWRTIRFGRANPAGTTSKYVQQQVRAGKTVDRTKLSSVNRLTGGFEYIGPPMDRELAERVLHGVPKVFGNRHTASILSTCSPGGFITAAAIARRIGSTTDEINTSLRRLVASGELIEQKIGTRKAYSRAAE